MMQKVPDFLGTSGHASDAVPGDLNSPLAAYRLFMSDAAIEHIVAKTNARAKLNGSGKYEGWAWWPDRLAPSGLLMFLGVLYALGLRQQPRTRSVWSNDTLYECQLIADKMSRDQFDEIRRHLCFANSSDPADPIHKV